MNSWWNLVVASVFAVGFFSGCTRGVTGGNPTLPLSNTNGTARLIDATENDTIRAMTNAFGNWRYHGMELFKIENSDWDYLARNWHPTGGYILFPLNGTTTNVPLANGNTVPYRPYFYIVTIPIETGKTRVVVRTVKAEVIDGQETGVHGGWANHYRDVPPVRREEENVLTAIAEELKREKSKSDEDSSKVIEDIYRNASAGEKQFLASIWTNIAQLGSYKDSAGRFLVKLREVTTANDLRKWALTCIQSSVGKPNDSAFWEGVNISFEQIPREIRTLEPTNLFVAAAVERKPTPAHVVISWGSGMGGFYGIMVGDASFVPPPERGYFTNWEDGIYVWHSDR